MVSSITSFRDYQLKEAWTWELQALTRARFVAGNPVLSAHFNRTRLEVLCRQRDEAELATELLEMRRKMNREHAGATLASPKHLPGGLIDIEFVAQLGVLSSARLYPRVLHETDTLSQLNDLMSIGWLTPDENRILREITHSLRQQRMMASLVEADPTQQPDTKESAAIFKRKMGESSRPVP